MAITTEACLNCSKFTTCSNPKKDFSYYCEKYKPVNRQEISEYLLDKKRANSPKNLDKLIESDEDNEEFNVSRIVNQVISDKSIVPMDVKLNDRHIPKAPNFFTFCTGEDFLNIKPFIPQAVIGTILHGEYCHHCTSIDWLLHDYKVTDSLKRFKKRVALLENGVCPHCKATKAEMVKDHLINPYQELVAICGQRCVTGDTLVYVDGQLVRIDSLDDNYPFGFTEAVFNVFNGGRNEYTTHFFKAEPEPIYRVELDNGLIIKGTKDHPILTCRYDFMTLEVLRTGITVYCKDNISSALYVSTVKNISILEPEITYDFTLPITHQFWSNGFISHNSGKSAITAMIFAYHIHRIAKLGKPNEVYGLLHSSIQHINFVALSFAGAKDLLYDPLHNYLTDSPWFISYHALLNNYQDRTGETIYKLNDTFLMYRHRALVVAPLGPDRRALRGKTRIGAAIDEVCHIPTDNDKAVKMNANEVYIALERSLLTIRASSNRLLSKGFSDIPTGLFCNISSPYSVRDKGMQLLRQSINSRKIYGIQRSTFEMNPTVTYEDLKEEYEKDPITAMRDYGAQPPLQSNAFIQSNEIVEACFSGKTNGIKISMAQKRYKNGQAERYGKITNIKESSKPSILTLDAGMVNNSFSCVVGHTDEEGKFIVRILVEIIPLPGIPINFSLMYTNIISVLIETQNVVLVLADRWNSIKILSDIRNDFGIHTDIYSLKYKDMWYVRDLIFESQVVLPKLSKTVKECLEYDLDNYPIAFDGTPAEHLALQLLTVRDTGNMILKGDGNLTDDIWRAFALAAVKISDEKYSELFANEVSEETTNKNIAGFAYTKGCNNTSTFGSVTLTSTSGKAIAVGKRNR